MPGRRPHLGTFSPIRPIGQGAQGKSTLMERDSDGQLAVRKRVKSYETQDGAPLEPIILKEILPSSRRIVELLTYSFEPSRHHGEDLIELFEYCKGGDLQHAVDHAGTLPEDFIWHCFIQIAEALDVVHNGGSQTVVHRDVKPDNIFLEQKYRHRAPWPNLKLGDFGAAGVEEESEGIFVPVWQGPELPLLSTAGDVWGVGAVVYWLGHGKPPVGSRPAGFRGSDREWRCKPEARRVLPLPRCYSGELNDHMMDCLAWEPDDRISSRELVERLKRDRRGQRR